MASGQWSAVLRHVQKLFQAGSVAGLTEGQLLDRLIMSRDEVAFGALVARHGPMVLGVCRGVLTDPHDVEDAFQATFLILVKKARNLRDRDRLGPWLYGVARRVSLRARTEAYRKTRQEQAGRTESDGPPATLDLELRELQSLIREEVDRLAHRDQMAVVLCYLEGLTHEEAADRLGWPIGTVKGRLSRARETLKRRLTRRGITLPSVFLTNLGQSLTRLVPTSLLQSTTLAATRLAAGQTLTAGIVSAQAILLMEGVIGTMFSAPLKLATTSIATCLFVAAPVAQALQGPATPANEAVPKSVIETAVRAQASGQKSAPAPSTADLAKANDTSVQIATRALANLDEFKSFGTSTATLVLDWSKRLIATTSTPGFPPAERSKILQARIRKMEGILKLQPALEDPTRETNFGNLEAAFLLEEAYRLLLEAEASSRLKAESGSSRSQAAGGGYPKGKVPAKGRPPLVFKPNPEDEKKNEAIRLKLEVPIAIKFATDTPFEDVKKYLQEANQDEPAGLPVGIPIYVDPDGLAIAEKTMASTVSIDLEGLPLRTTLRLILRQLQLDYRVTGGFLLISDEESIQKAESQERPKGMLGP